MDLILFYIFCFYLYFFIMIKQKSKKRINMINSYSPSSSSRSSFATTKESLESRTSSFIASPHRGKSNEESLKDLSLFANAIADFNHKEETQRSPKSPISYSIRQIFAQHEADISRLQTDLQRLRNKYKDQPYVAAQIELLYKKAEKRSPSISFSKLEQREQQNAINNTEILYEDSLLTIELDRILKDHLDKSYAKIDDDRTKESLKIWATRFSALEKKKTLFGR